MLSTKGMTSSTLPRGAVGAFSDNTSTRLRDFTDGSSNTVIIGELRKQATGDDLRGVLHYPEGPFITHNYTPNSSIADQGRWPNPTLDPPCTSTYSTNTNTQLIYSARSMHEGGVHVLMGDGAVRFVSENINLQTWQDLGVPNDGRVIGEF